MRVNPVLRGFEAMELCGNGARAHALIAADGCVPYRKSWVISHRYDGAAVEALLRQDSPSTARVARRLDGPRRHHRAWRDIGARAVVGAGSVVTSDVPEGMMAIGNPARVLPLQLGAGGREGPPGRGPLTS